MSVADNLNRIIQAKADIKAAIENKGVAVGDVTIDSYAEKINLIEQGESGKIVLPDGIKLSGSTWETFDMGEYDWKNVHDWGNMFTSCSNLTTLENIPQNVSIYGSMSETFYPCQNLTSVDLSGWDTSNVTNMSYMFYSCKNITSVDFLKNWNTSKVTDMLYMFGSCSKLTSIDLSNWDTSNVTNMSYMFSNCTNLTEVKMGGDVSNVTNMNGMFQYIETTGTFYYNPKYDYSKIIEQLPSTWTAVPME